MTESGAQVEPGKDRCHYPGCSRARRPDPATGRPTRYCGQADPDGGPVHNPASAWRARNAQSGATAVATQDERGFAAPVSLARASLEQQLDQLPEKVTELREYLDDVLAGIRQAGDVEAAGAEVEDAHRDALTKITEADRRTAAAERAAREAEGRAGAAERDREEADQLLEDAMAEMARVREEAAAEINQVRVDAEAAVERAQGQLVAAQDEHRARLAERDAEVEQARHEATAAQVEAAAAHAARQAAEADAAREREATIELRAELDQARHEAEAIRQRLQAELESPEKQHSAVRLKSQLRVSNSQPPRQNRLLRSALRRWSARRSPPCVRSLSDTAARLTQNGKRCASATRSISRKYSAAQMNACKPSPRRWQRPGRSRRPIAVSWQQRTNRRALHRNHRRARGGPGET